jgi:APA family basic amino acid/polyamine antiporter
MSDIQEGNHHTGLKRSIGLFAAFTLVVSQMIGSGVFKKIAPMTEELGHPGWVLLAWIVAGLITLTGALTNSEIAGMIADPGGQYAYFKRMYGRFFAFLFGWTSFTVIQTATAAGVAYVFAESLNALVILPRLPEQIEAISIFGMMSPFENSGVKIMALLLITLLTTINFRGVEFGGLVSNLFATTVVAAIFMIIVLGLTMSDGSVSHFDTQPLAYKARSGGMIVSAFFTAMMQAFWAYEGWNNLGFMGGEIRNPKRNIPLALVMGVGCVMLIYVMINAVYLYVLSPEQLIAISQGQNQIAAVEAVRSFLGHPGVTLVSCLIVVATFGSTNGVILTASRLFFAMAHDGLFFESAKKCHSTYKTPSTSLVMMGVWSGLLVISGSFDLLTDMLVFAAFLFYGAMALGVFVLRRTEPNTLRPVKAFGYPVIPALFIFFCLVLVINSFMTRSTECFIGLGLIFTGIPFYLFWNKGKVVKS